MTIGSICCDKIKIEYAAKKVLTRLHHANCMEMIDAEVGRNEKSDAIAQL